MKKLFLVLLLTVCASLSNNAFSQNTFTVQYLGAGDVPVVNTPTITRGVQSSVVKVRLTIANANGIAAEHYAFSSAAGLYIQDSPTASDAANLVHSTLALDPNKNKLDINVVATAATTLTIDMNVWAGQCFVFLPTDLNREMLTPFTLISETNNETLTLLSNPSINIIKGAFLNYFETESEREVMPDDNKIAIFSYVLVNNSGLEFVGNISFQESAVGTAYNIREVNFHKWNKITNAWEFIARKVNSYPNEIIGANENKIFTELPFIISSSILNGEKIRVQEIVKLNGCFTNLVANNSSPIIRWGNAEQDLCSKPSLEPFKSFIKERPFVATLQATTLNGANHYCYGGGENIRSYKIENNGNDVAKNVILNLSSGAYFYNNTPFFMKHSPNINGDQDNNDIYMTVNGVKYILNMDKYTIDFNDPKLYTTTDRPWFVPNNVPAWTTNGYGLYQSSLGYKKDKPTYTRFVPVNAYMTLAEFKRYENIATSFPFASECIGDNDLFNSVKLIKDLYADEFKRANTDDDYEAIEFKPDDEIIFYWKEFNCCFENETVNTSFSNSYASIQYDDLCGFKQLGFGGEVTAIQHRFAPAAVSGTTLGDFDRCRSTTDGLVERISATIQQYGAGVESPRFPDRYNFTNGRVVFRVYVQSGLDLDKALTQPNSWGWTGQRGYGNVTDNELYVVNAKSGCSGADCTADPICNVNTVYNAENYYVRLRPSNVGNGKLLIPRNIELIRSDNQIPQDGVDLKTITGLNADLKFGGGALYANQLYEITFNVEDLVAFYRTEKNITTAVDKLSVVNEILNQSILDFDLRAYCYGNGKPTYKVVMYHDRCTDGTPTKYKGSSCSPGYTNMQPVASFTNSMIVNCPGCKIPGANIEISTLVRSVNSRGLIDLNDDHSPDNDHDQLLDAHPTLKNVAMGDEMTATFTCYMSDGESANGLGISKGDLNAAAANNDDFYLDNFLIDCQTDGLEIKHVKMTYLGKIIEIDRDALVVPGEPRFLDFIFKVGSGYIIRANISNFYPNMDPDDPSLKSFEPNANRGIAFEITYNVGDLGDAIKLGEVTYAPYYTPCDECDEITTDMTLVNPADNEDFRPFTITKLASLASNKTLWKCSGFSNKFKFIPYRQLSAFAASDNNCTKNVTINFVGSFIPDGESTDYFKNEYRTFVNADLLADILIPNGYVPIKVEITNKFKIGTLFKYEKYIITDQNLIVQQPNPKTNNGGYDKVCKFLLKFRDEDSYPTYNINTFIGATNIKTWTNMFPDGTVNNDTARMFIRGDEFYNVSIIVTYGLDPTMACTAIPESFVWQGTGNIWTTGSTMLFENKANVPSYSATESNPQYRLIKSNPHAEFASTAIYRVDDVNGTNGVVASYKNPVANLNVRNLGLLTPPPITTNQILIPIEISNDKINSWQINTASYPYIQIYGDALTKGLKFVGVYKGNGNIMHPINPQYYNEYEITSTTNQKLINEGIVVGIDWQAGLVRYPPYNPIPLLERSVYQYTLVFENTWTENCNQNIGCGSGSTLPANCLVGNDNLKIKVGWNCNKFPSFDDLKYNRTCGEKDFELKYTVNTAPVGLTVNTHINNVPVGNNQIMELEPCEVGNKFTVTLNSCQEVGFSKYEIEFSGISSEVTIQEVNLPENAGVFLVTKDPTANKFYITPTDGTFSSNASDQVNGNNNIEVPFNIIVKSCALGTQNLTTIVRGKSYVSNTPVEYFRFNNPLKPKVNPATIIADNIALSTTGVTVNSQNQLAVQYTAAGAGAGVTKFNNTILVQVRDGATSLYSEVITIPAGTANGSFTKLISTGITSCNTYVVDLTTKRGYVPPCGVDGTGAIKPACINIFDDATISKNLMFGSGLNPSITTSTGYASFLCGTGGSVTLVASPSGLSYKWRNPEGLVLSSTTETVVVNEIGVYTVEVTNACGTYTASASVVNRMDVNCPAPICPGELPNIEVNNFGGVVGTYTAQWYDPNGSDGNDPADLQADILMDKGIFVSGYYYAAAVTPTCTLRTNAVVPQKCPIEVLRAPQAFHITSDKSSGDASILFLCDGNTAVLSVTNKTVNDAFATDVIWTSGQTTTDDVTVPHGAYEDYFITATDVETSCTMVSNQITIIRPYVHIRRVCTDGGQIKLTAVSNFDVTPDKYNWYLDGTPLVEGVDNVDALQAGVYTVEETATGCSLDNRCWGIQENLITTVQSDEQLSIQDGGFEGITATQAGLGFETDFEPLDRTGYTGSLPLDYTIGKFMINGANLEASDWSPNTPSSWIHSNTNHSGTGSLLIDGDSKANAQLIWGKTVPVTHGANYLCRFMVRNIDLLTQYPVQEIPELSLHISYLDGNGRVASQQSVKQAIFNNGQTPWIEFSSYTQALPLYIYNCTDPSEIQTVRLELFMKGGGSIGRDLSIDDFSLIPVGICQSTTDLNLPCNTALAEIENNYLVVCPGSTAQFNIVNAPAGLTYVWQKTTAGVITNQANGNAATFNTPALNLTDPLKPLIATYQVIITDPINNCQTRLAATAVVSPRPTLSISTEWTGSNCERSFVATYNGLGSPNQYEWYLNGSLVNETTANYVVANLQENDFVQSKLATAWCAEALPLESNNITIENIAVAADAGLDKQVCFTESVQIGAPAITGATYSWLPVLDLDDAHIAVPLVTPSGTQTSALYTLSATDVATGCVSTDEVVVTINPLPVIVVTNPVAVCAPSTVDVTLSSVTSGSTTGLVFTYFTDAAATNALLNPTAVSVSGTYYIKGTTADGCVKIEPVVVTINPIPVIVVTNPAAVCAPSTVDITLPSVTSGSTADIMLTYFTDVAATNALLNPAAVAVSETYYIKAATAAGCIKIESVEVTINPLPTITTHASSVCEPATVDLTLPAVTSGSTTGLVFTYFSDVTTTNALLNPTAVSVSETYYIKGTTAAGCFSTAPVDVTINPLPMLVVTNPTALCVPGTVDLTLPSVTFGSTTGLAFTYFSDAVTSNALLHPASVSISGTYYIKGVTTDGCVKVAPVVVTINALPSLVITNPLATVSPNVVDITLPSVTAGSTLGLMYTYFTDMTATSELLNPNAIDVSGTYYIKGTVPSTGCYSIGPVEVVVSTGLGVDMSTGMGSLKVDLSPNPFSKNTIITVSGATYNYVKVTLLDMNGKVVFENTNVPNNDSTPIGEDLPSAMYIVQVIDGEKTKTIKIVKIE